MMFDLKDYALQQLYKLKMHLQFTNERIYWKNYPN
jgi:hypothetical protein